MTHLHTLADAPRLPVQATRGDAAYSGDPEACDFCGRPLFDEQFFADAELPGRNGAWGILRNVCTTSHGIRPGWGRAQFYSRDTASSSWTCIAGAAPARECQFELAFHSCVEGTATCG